MSFPIFCCFEKLLQNLGETMQDKLWKPEGGILGYHCRHRYAYSGKRGKYVIEACLKGCDAALLSAAKFLNLGTDVLPVWQNPHDREFTDRLDEEEIEDWASDPNNSVEVLKRGQELIVSEKWKPGFVTWLTNWTTRVSIIGLGGIVDVCAKL